MCLNADGGRTQGVVVEVVDGNGVLSAAQVAYCDVFIIDHRQITTASRYVVDASSIIGDDGVHSSETGILTNTLISRSGNGSVIVQIGHANAGVGESSIGSIGRGAGIKGDRYGNVSIVNGIIYPLANDSLWCVPICWGEGEGGR